MDRSIVVWDLGATNQTVSLVSESGKILASRSTPTESENTDEGVIWPFEKMHERFCRLTKEALDSLSGQVEPVALGVSTFGVCWGPVDAKGNLTYPVISWKCLRTTSILNSPAVQQKLSWLYSRTGAPPMYFNTLFTLMWMVENHPEALDKAQSFLMMPQLFVHRLTGERVADRAMASTSMLVDLSQDGWDKEVFRHFSLPNKFPESILPCGRIAGHVTAGAALMTGLPEGLPVVAGGHDTVVGTASLGRSLTRRAYLSTGTWNLLVASSDRFSPLPEGHTRSLAWQWNPSDVGSLSGFNTQSMMIGGLALDWAKRTFAADIPFQELAERCEPMSPGAQGLRYLPNLVPGTGPFPKAPGSLIGLKDGLAPEHYYQAALEGLAFMVSRSRELMGLEVDEILIGGGLSKSSLFCRILAAQIGAPVSIAKVSETTSLGLAALAFQGAGLFADMESAWQAFQPEFQTIGVEKELAAGYKAVLEDYANVAERLS